MYSAVLTVSKKNVNDGDLLVSVVSRLEWKDRWILDMNNQTLTTPITFQTEW